jgi:hypothetical protein
VSLNAALKPKILLRGWWQPPYSLQWTRPLLPPLPRHRKTSRVPRSGSKVVRGGKIVQMDVWNDGAERLLVRNGIDG